MRHSSAAQPSTATGAPYSFLRPSSNANSPIARRSPAGAGANGAASSTSGGILKASTSMSSAAPPASGNVAALTSFSAVALGTAAGTGTGGGPNAGGALTATPTSNGVSFFSKEPPADPHSLGKGSLQAQTRLGYDIIEKAWPYVHAVARIPNKGSCILISLPNDLNAPQNGDPAHHGVLLTTSFVLRSREEAESESAVFLEAPVSGTRGKWPSCEPIAVRLRPDKFYTSSIGNGGTGGNSNNNSNGAAPLSTSSISSAPLDDGADEDDEALGYTVVACDLGAESNPRLSIASGHVRPLPLPIIVSKVPETAVGDVHLLITHADGRALSFVVGIVKEVHPHHCVYDRTRANSILSSGGAVFSQSGDFIGIQHQCGENSFCVFIRSLVIHLFDSAMLGPCRVSLWGDEDDAPWELRNGVFPRYSETYNLNSNNPHSTHASNYARLPPTATTHGGVPLLLGNNSSANNGGSSSALITSGSRGGGAGGGGRGAVVLVGPHPQQQQQSAMQSIYDPTEAEAHSQRPTWMARQRLRSVGACGGQLIEAGEFERFAEWERRRALLPPTLAPRTVREAWAEWHTDYQSLVLLLHAFSYSEQMVFKVLQAITSHEHRHSVASLAALGGIGIIVHALDSHPFSERVALAGVTALARLSPTADNKAALSRCDGVAVLVSIMYEWPASYEVQQWATYALLNLCSDSPRAGEAVRALVGRQGIEKVIHNMRVFPNGRHLQRWSAMLLVCALRGGQPPSDNDDGSGAVGAAAERRRRRDPHSINYNCFNNSNEKKSPAATANAAVDDAAADPLPPFVLEAWSVVLAPVTITERTGPRADTAMDAVSTTVGGSILVRGPSRHANDSSSSTTAAEIKSASTAAAPPAAEVALSIDLLPLLWRLVYAHKEDAYVMTGLASLLKELLCAVPPVVAAKAAVRNAAAAEAVLGSGSTGSDGEKAAVARTNSTASSTSARSGRGGAAATAVPTPTTQQQKELLLAPLSSYSAYARRYPLFHLPVAYFASPACLAESNAAFYAPILPHAAANKKGWARPRDWDENGDAEAEAADNADAENLRYISGRELRLRKMPPVPGVGAYFDNVARNRATANMHTTQTASPLLLTAGPAADASGDVAAATMSSASSATPYATAQYFTSSLDVLAHLLTTHGLRHASRHSAAAGGRSAEEEAAYDEEVRRLVTGTEERRQTAEGIADEGEHTRGLLPHSSSPSGGMASPSSSSRPSLSIEAAGSGGDVGGLHGGSGGAPAPVVRWGLLDVRGRLMRLVLGGYDLSANTELYRLGRRRESGVVGRGGTNDASASKRSTTAALPKQSAGDEADRADSALLTCLCHCLISLLLEADRCGLLVPSAVTPAMIASALRCVSVSSAAAAADGGAFAAVGAGAGSSGASTPPRSFAAPFSGRPSSPSTPASFSSPSHPEGGNKERAGADAKEGQAASLPVPMLTVSQASAGGGSSDIVAIATAEAEAEAATITGIGGGASSPKGLSAWRVPPSAETEAATVGGDASTVGTVSSSAATNAPSAAEGSSSSSAAEAAAADKADGAATHVSTHDHKQCSAIDDAALSSSGIARAGAPFHPTGPRGGGGGSGGAVGVGSPLSNSNSTSSDNDDDDRYRAAVARPTSGGGGGGNSPSSASGRSGPFATPPPAPPLQSALRKTKGTPPSSASASSSPLHPNNNSYRKKSATFESPAHAALRSVAADAVVTLRLPLVLIEMSFYHIAEAGLHALVLRILRLIGCASLCDPAAYPFLFHSGSSSSSSGGGDGGGGDVF